MKRLLILLLFISFTISIYAKEFAWYCAVEYTKENPEWVFVYEDVKLLQDGNYRVYVKWEFPDDPTKSNAKQTWIVTSDFDRMCVVESVGYDNEGNIAYFEKCPYGSDWEYILPDTYAESIVNTTKQILLKR